MISSLESGAAARVGAGAAASGAVPRPLGAASMSESRSTAGAGAGAASNDAQLAGAAGAGARRQGGPAGRRWRRRWCRRRRGEGVKTAEQVHGRCGRGSRRRGRRCGRRSGGAVEFSPLVLVADPALGLGVGRRRRRLARVADVRLVFGVGAPVADGAQFCDFVRVPRVEADALGARDVGADVPVDGVAAVAQEDAERHAAESHRPRRVAVRAGAVAGNFEELEDFRGEALLELLVALVREWIVGHEQIRLSRASSGYCSLQGVGDPRAERVDRFHRRGREASRAGRICGGAPPWTTKPGPSSSSRGARSRTRRTA